MSDAWDKLHSNQSRAQRDLTAAAKFEKARVDFVLKRTGLTGYRKRMAGTCHEIHGDYHLRFSVFNDMFPTFPFVMGCWQPEKPVHEDPKSTEPSRFKVFRKVPFVEAFLEFEQRVRADASGRNVALIFPRRGVLHGMCIHNDSSEQFWDHGLSWVYKQPDKSESGEKLYVHKFADLLAGVYKDGHGWRH